LGFFLTSKKDGQKNGKAVSFFEKLKGHAQARKFAGKIGLVPPF